MRNLIRCILTFVSIHASAASPLTLTIGASAEPTALDPHYQFLDPNTNIMHQIYEPLFKTGPQKDLLPGLGLSARVTDDPLVWEIQLRNDVKFSRGQAFAKADVLCTFQRIKSFEPGGYSANLKPLDLARTLSLNPADSNPYSLKLATVRPYRFLPEVIAALFVMSCEDTAAATALGANGSPEVLKAFADGRLSNGTGPYKLKRWTTLAQDPATAAVELERSSVNTEGDWDIVRYVPVLKAPSRVDRLLTKELDLIASVPQDRMDDLHRQGAVISSTAGLRVIHLQMYQGGDGREKDPLFVPVKNEDGVALANPLKSHNFREALAYAIDKSRLLSLMGGQALATDQYMLNGRVGYLSNRPGQIFDRARAREFLKKAAQEPGLEFLATEKLVITIHGPNDRYPNDTVVLEEVAKMWTEAFSPLSGSSGIRFVAKTESIRTYLGNAKKYMITLLGGGVDNGHAEGALRLYMTPGSSLNFANYSNPTVTALYQAGVEDTVFKTSDAQLTEALKLALEDRAILPLFNLHEVWSHRVGICHSPRIDGLTLAHKVLNRPCP